MRFLRVPQWCNIGRCIDVMEKSFTEKNASTQGAWSLVEGVSTIQPAYNLTWQFDYSMVGALFQVILEKGGLTMPALPGHTGQGGIKTL